MQKLLASLMVLAAVSTSALADRNYDLRDSDTYTGKFASNLTLQDSGTKAEALVVLPTIDADTREQRRLDEKNDVNN